MTVEHRDLSEPGRGLCSCGARPQAGQSIPAWWRQHIAPPVTAASGADQPTLRDQLAEWLARRDMAGSRQSWHEDADALLPLIEADRERAKAEAAAEALEQASMDKSLPGIFPSTVAWLRDRAAALRSGGGT